MTPSRILHRIAGSPAVDGCEEHCEERCYMCARPSTRGAAVRRWMGSTFMPKDRVRKAYAVMMDRMKEDSR